MESIHIPGQTCGSTVEDVNGFKPDFCKLYEMLAKLNLLEECFKGVANQHPDAELAAELHRMNNDINAMINGRMQQKIDGLCDMFGNAEQQQKTLEVACQVLVQIAQLADAINAQLAALKALAMASTELTLASIKQAISDFWDRLVAMLVKFIKKLFCKAIKAAIQCLKDSLNSIPEECLSKSLRQQRDEINRFDPDEACSNISKFIDDMKPKLLANFKMIQALGTTLVTQNTDALAVALGAIPTSFNGALRPPSNSVALCEQAAGLAVQFLRQTWPVMMIEVTCQINSIFKFFNAINLKALANNFMECLKLAMNDLFSVCSLIDTLASLDDDMAKFTINEMKNLISMRRYFMEMLALYGNTSCSKQMDEVADWLGHDRNHMTADVVKLLYIDVPNAILPKQNVFDVTVGVDNEGKLNKDDELDFIFNTCKCDCVIATKYLHDIIKIAPRATLTGLTNYLSTRFQSDTELNKLTTDELETLISEIARCINSLREYKQSIKVC